MLMVGVDWTRQGLWLRDYSRLNPKPNSNGRYQTLNALLMYSTKTKQFRAAFLADLESLHIQDKLKLT